MHACRFLRFVVLIVLALVAGGCASWLPKSRIESPTFQNFDDARRAVEGLVPMKSDLKALNGLGFDPSKQPNTLILSYPDIIRRFAPGNVLSKSDLDPGIVTCLNARDACRGWEINVARISKARIGNFWADFFNFKRHTVSTGWRFNALILMVDNVVVYRSWGGQPSINEVEVINNPLGPLQDIGPAAVTNR